MKELFYHTSFNICKLTTTAYSTSFSRGIKLLRKDIQPKIYAIYGFVRLADEVVDSFHGYDQRALFDRLLEDYRHALEYKISVNPVLNAFQQIVHKYQLYDLVDRFMESMKMDLDLTNYTSEVQYKKYIHGSAEVVGLMCLTVFVNNDQIKYTELKPYAIKLGSAFQKVNFLRDIQDDMQRLGRIYFPNVDWNNFTEENKREILMEIKDEFDEAYTGIRKLPESCKLGVFVAFNYYLGLWRKLCRKSSCQILKKRTRINNATKFCILQKSYLKYQLGMI